MTERMATPHTVLPMERAVHYRPRFINVPMLAKVTASDKQWPGSGLSADQVGYLLFDGNTSTFGDLNTASGSYYTVDFGEGAAVKLDEAVSCQEHHFLQE